MEQPQNYPAVEQPPSCSVDEHLLHGCVEERMVVVVALILTLHNQQLKVEAQQRGVTLVVERMGQRLGLWAELEMALMSSAVLPEGAEHQMMEGLKAVNCAHPVNSQAWVLGADKLQE